MSGYDMTHRMKPNARVRMSVHGKGAVFLHVRDARLFAANPVGAEIWKGLERQLDSDAIAAELHERYGAPCEEARAHVIGFIHDLEGACTAVAVERWSIAGRGLPGTRSTR